MRQIKFRGKANNGRWIYGGLVYSDNIDPAIYFEVGHFVISGSQLKMVDKRMDWAYVDPATVGQFTGLQDADGNDIYEGDMLLSDENAEVFEVVYDAPRFCFKDNVFGFRFLNHPEFFHVIGNRYDDPELIEEGGEV